MRTKHKKTLERLDDQNSDQNRESELRLLINLAERMRKEGEYNKEDMEEIIRRANENITANA